MEDKKRRSVSVRPETYKRLQAQAKHKNITIAALIDNELDYADVLRGALERAVTP